MELRIFKFGGTSLNDPRTIQIVGDIIREKPRQLVVVVSAMGGMTDLLLNAGEAAARGDLSQLERVCTEFSNRHKAAADALLTIKVIREQMMQLIQESTQELTEICQSVSTLREFTPKAMAKTVARGERMMAQLVTAMLKNQGVQTEYVDAVALIPVTKGPLGLTPDQKQVAQRAQTLLLPLLNAGTLPVVPGFIAQGVGGEVVTLGRGGSDYTASLLAEAMNATSITLYKEVKGLMTADPRFVKEARIIPEMHYREAAELSYYGAKILHPRSIIPLIKKQIPLTLKSTFDPSLPGTLIAGDVGPGEYPVKALTAITQQALVSIEGNGMIGVPGIAERTFQAMRTAQISVTMISQASSEASICFTVPNAEADAAKESLELVFRFELDNGYIDRVTVLPEVAILAIVGLGMSGTRGIAARAFTALAHAEINVIAIAQGSSELNISVVIGHNQVQPALQALHREYRLDKIRALPHTTGGEINLVIYGLGQIGRALCEQIIQQRHYFDEKLGIKARIVGLVDRSGVLVKAEGFSDKELQDLMLLKTKGGKLAGSAAADSAAADSAAAGLAAGPGSATSTAMTSAKIADELRTKLWSLPLRRSIFIDLTAEESAPILLEALTQGMHVVLANKKPLAIPLTQYNQLLAVAAREQKMLRYEATVGAGLPILDTLAKLKDAGDEILKIEGCLSGTLGFLMTALEEGQSYSEAVRLAWEKGYTEPDPREDLSGMDVARKALILARTLSMKVSMDSLQVKALYPEAASHDDPKEFIRRLQAADDEYRMLMQAVAKDGKCYRYVATISDKGVTVGMTAVDKNSPFGRLQGTANQIVLTTKRYLNNPLIVTGPGAGADVTAAGVLNDIVALAMTDA